MSDLIRVDVDSLDEDDVIAYTEFSNAMRAEADETFPPRPVREVRAMLFSPPAYLDLRRWWVRDGRRVIAEGQVELDTASDTNRHVAEILVNVLPAHRRQGFGRTLLGHVADEAESMGRTLLFTYTELESGHAFMEWTGATVGMRHDTNQLLIDDLDRELMEGWMSRGAELAGEFELVWWDGSIPTEHHQEVADLMKVMSDQPFGDLEVEDLHFTSDHVRDWDASLVARGIDRWMLAVRERSSGRLAGYTAMFLNPTIPDLGQQGDTGVFPEYRGRGLGRWLKAAMILRLVDERPGVTRVRTGNAQTNAPMLKINYEMGFTPFREERIWQLDVAKAQQVAQAIR